MNQWFPFLFLSIILFTVVRVDGVMVSWLPVLLVLLIERHQPVFLGGSSAEAMLAIPTGHRLISTTIDNNLTKQENENANV